MTPDEERLRALVEVAADPANKIPPSWWASFGRECADVLPAVLAEIDRLRALPVIATCGECGHTPSRYARPRVCQHPANFDREDPVLLAIEHDEAPPTDCPLRGGGR